jgi:hypothetical protein
MPYVFINDGSPEASDYDSNYVYYDEDDLESMETALDVIHSRDSVHPSLNAPAERTLTEAIARKKSSSVEPRHKRSLVSRLAQFLWSL